MVQVAGVALLLLIAFLPGLSFRRTYFTGPFSKQYKRENLNSLLVAAFIPALGIQLFGRLTSDWFKTRWFYDFISERLFGSEHATEIITALPVYPIRAAVLQQILLILIGGISGAFARSIVRKFHLDLKYKLFRFDNLWQYIFYGEIFSFPEVPNFKEEKGSLGIGGGDAVAVDLLLSAGGELYLYKGELFDYHLAANNRIDYLILSDVSRRKLSSDPKDLGKAADEVESTKSDRFYSIPGDMLVFRGEDIINVNVRFPRLTSIETDLYAMYGEPTTMTHANQSPEKNE